MAAALLFFRASWAALLLFLLVASSFAPACSFAGLCLTHKTTSVFAAPTSASSSFLSRHRHIERTTGSNHNNNNNNNAAISSRGGRSTCFASSSLHNTAPNTRVSNIFENYKNKPIVLLGASSERKELPILAKSLAQTLKTSVVDSIEAASSLDVLVLDTSQQTPEIVSELASTMHQDCIIIYVNVFGQSNNNDLEDSLFVPNSDYELCIRDEVPNDDDDDDDDTTSNDWEHIQWELVRLVARALLPPAIPGDTTQSVNTAHLTMGSNTFFLSLSFPDIVQVQPYVEQMCEDVDAMEYRTDLLECRTSRFDLIYGQQLLRKYCRPHAKRVPGIPLGGLVLDDVMPIVYTVRTQNQAGTYPDDEAGIESMFQLLQWGLRSGVEVLDVESAWDETKTNELLALAEERYASQILGSHHVVGEQIPLEDAVQLYRQCSLNGRAHGAKVVLSIDSEDKDKMAYQAALISQSLAEQDDQPVLPSISLILGEIGQFSRIINIPFTPVTHESLPFKAAPGQLTANEIMATRLLTKLVVSKKYCILGHKIDYSVSPAMHNAAFEALRLPHQYARADVETVQEFIDSDFFKGSAFGGASVTIPHKQSIMSYVDVLSDAAKEIGSVNTLVVKERIDEDAIVRYIYGDNTDWKGIFNPLQRRLVQQPSSTKTAASSSSSPFALILGAGGTARAAAYAAQQLGLERLYFNRTPEKAQELVDAFGGTVVASLEQDGDLKDLDIQVVISTLPGAAGFTLPDWILPQRPIVFDVNYKPYSTALLEQALKAECLVVRGSEMLWEQGVGQFEQWTERTAPYKVMKTVVLDNCLPKEEEDTSLAFQ